MTIGDLKSVQMATGVALNSIGKETQEAANEIKTLFSQKFYNGGADSAQSIDAEIKKLENTIETKKREYDETYATLKYTSVQLTKLNEELEEEVYKATKMADRDERLQKAFIETAIDEVNEMYMNGEITKEEMSPKLARRVAKYKELSPDVVSAMLDVDNKKSQINVLTGKISNYIDKVNLIESSSKIAQGTLELMKNLAGKMTLGRSNSQTAANERPIYTPTKQALVDELAQGIKGTGSRGVNIDNPQLGMMKDFLGMNNNGNVDAASGVNANSMLLKMKEAGFDQKEALYAINWIFDGCCMNYQPGGQWSVPYGHDADSKAVYNELISQADKLWGASATQDIPVEEIGAEIDESTPSTPTPAPVTPKRTDPIGYAINDTTFEFVVDRNGDGKFNDKSEFLGAKYGINELKALDANNDGVISSNELKTNDLYVLMTDHKTGEHKFMSAADGNIKSIDLSTLSSKNWTNINDNKLSNVFTITTNANESVQGYQTEDSAFYISKSYNGVVGNAEMGVEVDETAMNKAENIFSQIVTLSDEEYVDANENLEQEVFDAKAEIADSATSLADEAAGADAKLNKNVKNKVELEKERLEEKEKADKKKAEEKKAEEKRAQERIEAFQQKMAEEAEQKEAEKAEAEKAEAEDTEKAEKEEEIK